MWERGSKECSIDVPLVRTACINVMTLGAEQLDDTFQDGRVGMRIQSISKIIYHHMKNDGHMRQIDCHVKQHLLTHFIGRR